VPEKPKALDKHDTFLDQVSAFLKSKNIKILDVDVVRKNSDIDLTVELSSTVGKLIYYCKCKNKKRVNDADLSSAYVKAQFMKLPVLFVTPGELTKKATGMLDREFKSITISRMKPAQ